MILLGFSISSVLKNDHQMGEIISYFEFHSHRGGSVEHQNWLISQCKPTSWSWLPILEVFNGNSANYKYYGRLANKWGAYYWSISNDNVGLIRCEIMKCARKTWALSAIIKKTICEIKSKTTTKVLENDTIWMRWMMCIFSGDIVFVSHKTGGLYYIILVNINFINYMCNW